MIGRRKGRSRKEETLYTGWNGVSNRSAIGGTKSLARVLQISSPRYPVIFSMTFDEREMCLAAFNVDNVLSIFAIGGIIPYNSTWTSGRLRLLD